MPDNAPVVLVPGSLPEGYCLTTYQKLLNDFFNLSSGYIPGNYNFFNYGNTEPAADDRNKPWLRLNADGSRDDWYVFFTGQWLAPYRVPASSDERRLWVGLEAVLPAYDGGEVAVVSDSTGPFWEVDHDFDARFPVGPGTFDVDPADPASGQSVSVGGEGGKENSVVTIGMANLAPHQHDIGCEQSDDPDAASETGRFTVADGTMHWRNTAGVKVGKTRPGGGASGAATPLSFTNLPPYRGIFTIKRTARLFKRAIP